MMNNLLVTADVMREVDRMAIEDYGVHGTVLMENAGAGTARAIRAYWPDAEMVAIFCGSGNNGGDGYVIARHLINAGIEPVIYMMADREKIKGDAKVNLDIVTRMNAVIMDIKSDEDIELLGEVLYDYDLVVDAMLGTGLTKELTGKYRKCVEMINETDVPVCAVDIPSGLSSDTGTPLGEAVICDVTCTYGMVKVGQVVYPGADYVGELVLVNIGIPLDVLEQLGGSDRILDGDFIEWFLPARLPDAHKGDFGHLLVIAGSPGKTGAAAMCAEAAVRSGAGLVTAAVPSSLNSVLETKLTEAMTLPLADGGSGYITHSALRDVEQALEKAAAIALGPGMGTEAGSADFVFELIEKVGLPMVVDADGLNILASNPDALKEAGVQAVLTPHPGEMARLLDTSTKAVQSDRIAAAKSLAARTGAVVLLKGARTIIASPDGTFAVNPTGNPGMASGGAGDVLTGVIGALLARGIPLFEAACAGAWIHGAAGDVAAEDVGEISLAAGDIIDALPEVFQALTSEEDEE